MEARLQRVHGDPTLKLVLAKEFGSDSPEHRLRLRERIAHDTFARERERARILDLDAPLLHAGGRFVSISHCAVQGGFVIAADPIGLDLEMPARVRPAVVDRVSAPGELQRAPSPAVLWAAKEAAFKALQHADTHPALVSQIEIDDWEPSDSDSLSGTFRMRNLSDFSSRAALGCFINEKDFILCTFALAP